jgi:hypothetical protein
MILSVEDRVSVEADATKRSRRLQLPRSTGHKKLPPTNAWRDQHVSESRTDIRMDIHQTDAKRDDEEYESRRIEGIVANLKADLTILSS